MFSLFCSECGEKLTPNHSRLLRDGEYCDCCYMEAAKESGEFADGFCRKMEKQFNEYFGGIILDHSKAVSEFCADYSNKHEYEDYIDNMGEENYDLQN